MARLPNRANARINRGLIGPLNSQCIDGQKGDGPRPPNFVTNLRDFWTNDTDLTSFETNFNVTGSNLVLEMNFLFEGEPFFTITHGEDVLNIIAVEYNTTAGMGCLIAVGDGVKVEVAQLNITATGGTFGGLAGRIRALDYAPEAAWTKGIQGIDKNTHDLRGYADGEIIGTSMWATGYVDSGKFAELDLKSRVQVLGNAESIPYTTSPVGEYWEEVAPGVYHTDTPPTSNRPQKLFDFTFDAEYPAPLYWDFAVTTNGSVTFTGVGNVTTNNNWVTGIPNPVVGANVTQKQSTYNTTFYGAKVTGYGDTTVGSFKFYSNPGVHFSGIHAKVGVRGSTYRNTSGGQWVALAACLGVKGATKPEPEVGPLDYIENRTGLSDITVEYDLGRNVAMLGVAFRHAGITGLTATHGGEPLELVQLVLDEEDNIGAAVFISNGLTVEPADLVITPIGATIGPAVVRIDDSFYIDNIEVGFSGTQTGRSYIGAGTQPSPIELEGANGQGWGVYALAVSGAEADSYARGVDGADAMQVLFSGVAASGDMLPVTGFAESDTWAQDGDWWQHSGSAYSYLVASDFPELMPNPFWWEIEIDVPSGSRIYVQTQSAGGTYLSETFIGPVSGVFRRYRHQTYEAKNFRIQANGAARFRNFRYNADGEVVYGVFGRTTNTVPAGGKLQFQIGKQSRYAGVVAEVHNGDGNGVLGRDGEPLNMDGADLRRV